MPSSEAGENLPKKRGRKPGENQTEEQAQLAANKRRSTLNTKVYGVLAGALTMLGGVPAFTTFFVMMIASALGKVRTLAKNKYLSPDVHKRILDDPVLYEVFRKEIDARRKPELAAFVRAKLSGVTFSAMDKLRFSTTWTPGHSTLCTGMKEIEKKLERQWCPSGPTASHGTTRTASQQMQDDEAELEKEEVDEELEADVDRAMDEAARSADPEDLTPRDDTEPAAEQAAEATALSLQDQALKLLQTEFPTETEEDLMDRWAGGIDAEGVLSGCNVLQIMAVRDGVLLGFYKVLVTAGEIWIDEVLNAPSARGLGISWHLLHALLTMFSKRPNLVNLVRLQVRVDNPDAIGLYTNGWDMKPWANRASGAWAGVKCHPDDGTYAMYEGTRTKMLKKLQAYVARKPLASNIQVQRHAAFAIPGITLDRVGTDPEGSGTAPEEDPPPPDDDLDEEELREPMAEEPSEDGEPAAEPPSAEELQRQAEREQEEREEAAVSPFADDDEETTNLDADTSTQVVEGASPSYGCTSLINALTMMFVALCHLNVIVDPDVGWGSMADSSIWYLPARMALKITCDAASLVNAPKGYRGVTTCIMQLLGCLEDGKWSNLARNLAYKVQSCSRAFVLRDWFGKDNAPNVCGHRHTARASVAGALSLSLSMLWERVRTEHAPSLLAAAGARRAHDGGSEEDGRHQDRARRPHVGVALPLQTLAAQADERWLPRQQARRRKAEHARARNVARHARQ